MGRAVVVGRGRWGSGRARSQRSSRWAVCSLVCGRVEGLDAVGGERADQVVDLVGRRDVPVGVGEDGHAARLVDQLDRLLGGRPAAGDECLRARDQVLLEEGAEVSARPAARAMWGRPIESASPASRDRVLEVRSKPSRRSLSTISPARVTAPAGRARRRPRSRRGRSSSRDVEVFGVLVDAGHLHRRHQLDPQPPAAATASATPAIASWSVSASVVTPASAAALDDPGGRAAAVGDRRVAL